MKIVINEELIAAFLEGNTTLEETVAILRETKKNQVLRRLLEISSSLEVNYNEVESTVETEEKTKQTNCGQKTH